MSIPRLILVDRHGSRIGAQESGAQFAPRFRPQAVSASVTTATETAASAVETATCNAATVKPGPTKASTSHCCPGVESATLRSGSRVDAMGVGAAGCVVRSRSPGADVCRIKRVVGMTAVERRPIYKSRRVESPAEWAVEDSIKRQEGIGPDANSNAEDWAPDGKSLYYRYGDKVYVVEVRTDGSKPEFSAPKELMTIPQGVDLISILPDGKRILAIRSVGHRSASPQNLVLNWQHLVR